MIKRPCEHPRAFVIHPTLPELIKSVFDAV